MKRILAVDVAAVALVLLTRLRGRPPREKLDHFRFYAVVPEVATIPAITETMQLLGQMNTPARERLIFAIRKLDFFGVPVIKNDENDGRFEDPNDHLAWYDFVQPGAEVEPWKVWVTNQYTNDEEVEIELDDKPAAVLVPTWKKKGDLRAPQQLSHFKYRIVNGKSVNEPVALRDQFLTNQEHVVLPVFFAVPVRKKVHGRWHEIVSKPHLTVYRLSGTNVPDPELFEIENPFEERHKYRAVRSEFLAVPTRKTRKRLRGVHPDFGQ